jgi:hypothetical protein
MAITFGKLVFHDRQWMQSDQYRKIKLWSRSKRPAVEIMEPRIALSGSWTQLEHLMPAGGTGTGSMVLLSNGTVMVQGGGASSSTNANWYLLTPNAQGSYVNGTWSKVPNPMHLRRSYAATVILPDGEMMILGGEYSGPKLAKNFSNETEIYDPVSRTWTVTAPVPDSSGYGDEPAQVLPNGTVLTPDGNNTHTYIYNPATNTWVDGPSKLNNDASYEENWLKMPNGQILAVPTEGNALRTAQYFVVGQTPSQDMWVATARMPSVLSYGPRGAFSEMGPGFLLPDGRVWQTGGNSVTAIFTPATSQNPAGKWVAGPSIPQRSSTQILTGADSAGAKMPNGKVIFDASPWLGSPAYFFQFDPTANGGAGKITSIAPPKLNSSPGGSIKTQAELTSMLVLPTGQVLYADISDSQLWVYTPGGSPANSWKPTIKSIAKESNGGYLLTGTKLNGMSEGAAPGDDVSNSTNFPIVRFTASNGDVYYARSFNWSNTGVQTGSTPVTTEFVLPPAIPTGSYKLQLIASGIASNNFTFKVPRGTT